MGFTSPLLGVGWDEGGKDAVTLTVYARCVRIVITDDRSLLRTTFL